MNTNDQLQIKENMQSVAIKLSELMNDYSEHTLDNDNFDNFKNNEECDGYVINDEVINIDDYVLAEEETEFGNLTNLVNIFTCYFKQLFERKEYATIFDGLDYDKEDEKTGKCTSTNKCMEHMYEEMFKYNKSIEEDKDILYDPDSDLINIDICEELYVLYVDSEPKFVCKFIMPILHNLSNSDWSNIEWSILKIKG